MDRQRQGGLGEASARSQNRAGRWHIAICTRGGNQSWSGVAKYFSAERCDVLFVATVDGRRRLIDSAAVEATTALRLGGPKYAEFEVAKGPPLAAPQTPQQLSCAPRRDSEAVKRTWL